MTRLYEQLWRYGVALLSIALAGVANAVLWPALGTRYPLIAFFPAIAISARFGGFWPGAFATTASTTIVGYLWFAPQFGNTGPWRQGQTIALLIFFSTGWTIAYPYETLRSRTERAEHAEREAAQALREAQAAERLILEAERSARQHAEHASRLKDELVSVVSHELRTPLSSILGWANLLKQGIAGNEDRERALQAICRNAKRQADLLSDLLDTARMNSGRLPIESHHVDFGAVVREAWEVIEPLAAAKGLAFRVTLDPAVAATPFFGDASRLQQVMSNLLSNAVKFTPRGGRIDVLIRRHDGSIELVVADTGRGIPPEFLPALFEPFRKADTTDGTREDGFGLGLSIVKQLVEAHGGQIQAISPGLNQGSRFTVRLPVDADAVTLRG